MAQRYADDAAREKRFEQLFFDGIDFVEGYSNKALVISALIALLFIPKEACGQEVSIDNVVQSEVEGEHSDVVVKTKRVWNYLDDFCDTARANGLVSRLVQEIDDGDERVYSHFMVYDVRNDVEYDITARNLTENKIRRTRDLGKPVRNGKVSFSVDVNGGDSYELIYDINFSFGDEADVVSFRELRKNGRLGDEEVIEEYEGVLGNIYSAAIDAKWELEADYHEMIYGEFGF